MLFLAQLFTCSSYILSVSMVCGQTTIQCLTLVFSNFSDCCPFESCLSGRPCFPIESCDEVSSRLCKPDCTLHSVPSASLLWGWVQHCWWTVLLGQPSYSPFCGTISRNPTTNQVSFTNGYNIVDEQYYWDNPLIHHFVALLAGILQPIRLVSQMVLFSLAEWCHVG